MKILVDAFGGDNAPKEIIKGAVEALKLKSGFEVVLFGDQETIKAELVNHEYDASRLFIEHASEIVTNDDNPTMIVRTKKNSSLVKGIVSLGIDPDAAALVSAGSTGAVLASAVLLLKRIKGVSRPALVPVLPTQTGGSVALIDCGANADCTKAHLVQFAYMGSAFAKTVLGSMDPSIGLLSNGVENKKGNELNRETFPLLQEAQGLNFKGNLEARDILSGNYDVVVCDGFSGNIALKASEGVAVMLFDLIKQNILASGLRAKIGYLLLKPVFKKIAKTMDYNNNGGALLLGLQKTIIKAHGSSTAKSIAVAIIQAYKVASAELNEKIEKLLADPVDEVEHV
ncbi:MAG: phosphate acyltransferase PlsX [Christensenellaceae bacterium]|jgi:glycerol-3-phosphate acyltransferase PlsX|nr:phosphate acyltransferase PlsX [Christensenellaceae bacterium]